MGRSCSRMGGGKKTPLPNICHTYPTIIKLGTVKPYLKTIQKDINHVTHPLFFLTSAFSHWKLATFFTDTDIDCILIHNY